jgi:tetratricopeptide (TPR) repeat protein
MIPIVVAVIIGGYVVGKVIGTDDEPVTSKDNQALEIERGDLEERIKSYETFLTTLPDDADALRSLGDGYLELGNLLRENNEINDAYAAYKSAVDNYRKHLAAKPDSVEARIDLGLAYASMQMGQVAVRELQLATQQAPTNQRAWHVLGFVYDSNLNELEEAKKAWEKSYALNPTSNIGQESKQFLDQANAIPDVSASGGQTPIQ